MTPRCLALLAFAILGSLAGCEEPSGGPVNTTLAVETPTFVGYAAIGTVEYRLSSGKGTTRAGTFERAGVSSRDWTDEGERTLVWRSSLSLPAQDYVLELIGRSQGGDVLCMNETAFAVAADLPTELRQRMTCDGPADDPIEPLGHATITVHAPDQSTIDEFPRFIVLVSCGDLDPRSQAFDMYLPLDSESSADFGFGPIATNVWRAELNDLPPGLCRVDISRSPTSTHRSCAATFDFKVTANETTPVNFILPCAE